MSSADSLSLCPTYAPALGFGGAMIALVMACVGSAYGTGKAAMGISTIGVEQPDIVMKNIIPVVMAGVLGIYGLIIAVIISNQIVGVVGNAVGYSLFTGFAHLGAGLCCGMSGLAAGVAIGVAGDAGVRAVAKQGKMYVGMVLILIFAEALGLYGLIIGLIMTSKNSEVCGAGPVE
ncbi:vacuolar H+-ATPase, subunit C [Emiliania huxleyi CCMP1516]|uniref:V-type proton ATPase proteolipid subunit n=2 Tax=Emiliania huxleyi TaxID=2903 RepID=A0A0D3JA08_EMIH1|nr:vacuolar H+-ATPase, subunit C [Emiliania huxleyi CCMP1516]EOD20343.1 vacuolar H+-ATPase, subunit C [Emiliania huxleyi CCMP1516]|eukprot:XP_005772772.1 vacuolar H+-ATPase, subunit C [Emiliania huxleyi CCMP1516]